MKMSLIALVLLSTATNLGYAESPQRGSFANNNSAKTASAKMAMQNRRAANLQPTQVTRSETRTRADGATATRTTVIDRNPETKTISRQTTGERFDGSSYSSTDIKQRTEDGYTRDSSRTNAQGETSSRFVTTHIDPAAGTLHKEITVTDKTGETYTRVIDKTRQTDAAAK